MTHKMRRMAATVPLLLTALLAGCVSTGSNGTGATGPSSGAAEQTEAADAPGSLILQSRFTDAEKAGLDQLVKDFNALGQGTVEINTIPTQTFNSQLPTYLTGSKPPDVYTWYAGQATRDFSDQNLLLDLSDVWSQSMTNYPAALRSLSQTTDGTQEVFVPTGYYWWGVYYFKSDFEKLGVTPPKTWDEFVQVAQKIKSQGVNPFTMGLSDNAWLASAWFDYLDVRINGGQFHLDLLSGKKSYDSPEVKAVLSKLAELLPYFDPAILGLTHNQAMSDFAQGKSAMYLLGAWAQPSVPEDQRDDLAFFQFPVIDPSVPIVEEGPTDGFIASAKTDKPALTKRFLAYLASADAQGVLMAGQQGTALAANPDVKQDLDPLAQQGKTMLESAAQITQFYNRDAGDAQQTPADAAMTRLVAEPTAIDSIAAEWQAAAEQVRANS